MILRFFKSKSQLTGAPNEKKLAKYLKYHFFFLRLFQSFLKACLCELIQIESVRRF